MKYRPFYPTCYDDMLIPNDDESDYDDEEETLEPEDYIEYDPSEKYQP